MTRKRKNLNELDSRPVSTGATVPLDSGRQPRILGWLVLIAGACSTWYWYRPLPPSVAETVHSTLPNRWPTSQSGPRSLWTDDGMIVPNIADALESSKADQGFTSEPISLDATLASPPYVALIPSDDARPNIREMLKTERIPRVPVEPMIATAPSNSTLPPLWSPDQQSSKPAVLANPNQSAWPDLGYVPKQPDKKSQQKQANPITTQFPHLLETGMRSIRTSENHEASVNDASTAFPPATKTEGSSTAERQPQFIRQPSK